MLNTDNESCTYTSSRARAVEHNTESSFTPPPQLYVCRCPVRCVLFRFSDCRRTPLISCRCSIPTSVKLALRFAFQIFSVTYATVDEIRWVRFNITTVLFSRRRLLSVGLWCETSTIEVGTEKSKRKRRQGRNVDKCKLDQISSIKLNTCDSPTHHSRRRRHTRTYLLTRQRTHSLETA